MRENWGNILLKGFINLLCYGIQVSIYGKIWFKSTSINKFLKIKITAFFRNFTFFSDVFLLIEE